MDRLKLIVKKIRNNFRKEMSETVDNEDALPLKEPLPSSPIPLQDLSSPSQESISKVYNEEKGSSLVNPTTWHRCKDILAVLSLYVANLLGNAAFSMMAPFFPSEAREHGASTFITGVIISCAPLCVVIFSPVLGYVLNLIGVRLLNFIGLLMIGTSYITMAFVVFIPIDWLFILASFLLRLIEGIGTAMFLTSTFTTIPNLFPNSVGTCIAMLELTTGVGYAVGFPMGSFFYSVGGFQLPFLAVGMPLLVMIIPCTLLLKKIEVVKQKKTLPFKLLFRLSTDVMFILLTFVLILAISSIAFYAASFETYIMDTFNIKHEEVGLLAFIIPSMYFFTTLPVGPIIDKLGYRRTVVIIGLVLIISGYLVQSLPYFTKIPKLWYVIVSFFLTGTGVGFAIVPVFADMLKRSEKYATKEHGKEIFNSYISGIVASSFSFGEFFGSVIGGLLNTFLSFHLSALVYGEVIVAEAVLISAVTLIDYSLQR